MHKFNRAVFFNVDGSSPLLRLYARLVALELTLKDEDPSNYARRHNVVQMVKDLSSKLGAGAAAMANLADGLDRALAALHCTAKNGTAAQVSSAVYPGVRYLRHERDFPGATTDTDLADAVQALEALLLELDRHKVKPC